MAWIAAKRYASANGSLMVCSTHAAYDSPAAAVESSCFAHCCKHGTDKQMEGSQHCLRYYPPPTIVGGAYWLNNV